MAERRDIKEAIAPGENETAEFKSHFNDAAIETIVAFANTHGGNVYIGVQDNGTIAGIDPTSETIVQWINEVKNKTTPHLVPSGEVIEIENKIIVKLSIQEYPIKPVAFRGKYYKRVKNSNHLLSTSEVVNMHLQTFNTSWDYHLSPQFGVEDISLDKVQQVIDTANQEQKLNVRDDPYTFLLKSDLVREGRITNAAYLLFTNKTSLFTTIELGRFQTDIIIKDSARSKTDIVNQVEDVMAFVKKHINKEVIITEAIRNTQRWQYPLDALREIILNMVIHRDYRSSSDSIVKVFDHKIEFYNPGRLPDTISIDDLLNNNYRSTPRNKLIADFAKSVGIIEKYGSGIQRIMNYFKEAKLPQPTFENISDGFQVVVFDGIDKNIPSKNEGVNEGVSEGVNEGVNELFFFIEKNPGKRIPFFEKELNIPRKTLERWLKELRVLEKIEFRGAAKTGGYFIKKT